MSLFYYAYTFFVLVCTTCTIQSSEPLINTLQTAITSGDTQTIIDVIQKATPKDLAIEFNNTTGDTLPKKLPLLLYLWQNRFLFTTKDLTKILEIIVPKDSSLLKKQFTHNDTLFHILARNSNDYQTQPFFKELMQQSNVDDYNKKNADHQTPLSIAIQTKNNQILSVILLTLTNDKWERLLKEPHLLTQALQAENLEALYILLMAGITPTELDQTLLQTKKFKDEYVQKTAYALFNAQKQKQPLLFPLEFFSIKGLQPITIIYALNNNGFVLFNDDNKKTPIIYGDIPGNKNIGPRTVDVALYKDTPFIKNSQKTLPARILEEFPAEERIIQALQDQKLINTAMLQPQDIATYFSQAEPQAIQQLLKSTKDLPKNKAYINENLFNMDFTGTESNKQREEKALILLGQGITPSATTIKQLLENQSENSTLGALLFEKAQPEIQKKVINEDLLNTLLAKTDVNPHNLNLILAHTPPAQRNALITSDVLKETLHSKNAAVSATLFEYAPPETQKKVLQELPTLNKMSEFKEKNNALVQTYTNTLFTNLSTCLGTISLIAI